MTLDLSTVSEIEWAGIDRKDAPDFCDAYIDSAYVGIEEATERQLEFLNGCQCDEWRYEQLQKHLY